ncbi:hypothetical protein N9K75_00185 [bacterium]|nr:hypothetical protein [bacterium]
MNSTFFNNTNTNHQIIPSSQEYMFYKKYVSIHSEDRDILKYPNSSEFEITLPEDLLNVSSLRLVTWAFPSNYNTFSILNSNVEMFFQINNPYNPSLYDVSNNLDIQIYNALDAYTDKYFKVVIEEGFYTPTQMVTELTHKFNYSVTNYLIEYFTEQLPDASYNDALTELKSQCGYSRFSIVYNNVSQKIWFGNICDQFIMANTIQDVKGFLSADLFCGPKSQLPDFSNFGLPGFLGLSRPDQIATNKFPEAGNPYESLYNGIVVPRFYYGDVNPGDNGFWLLPDTDLSGSTVYWVASFFKINLMGDAYIYMELDGQNCLDETSPFNVSPYTLTTNNTNGVVNSAFAKMPVPSTPISQFFDKESHPYKFYYPPAEKLRKFKFKIRYHNGKLVNFGTFNFTFILEFVIQLPQILRKYATSDVIMKSNR